VTRRPPARRGASGAGTARLRGLRREVPSDIRRSTGPVSPPMGRVGREPKGGVVMSRRVRRSASILAASLLALGLSGPAAAEGEDAGPLSRFSGSMGVDFTNAYIFRGIMQEDDGFIAQPWAELDYNVYSSETGFLRDVTIGAGVWNSFHSEKTLAENAPTWLYETDWYPVVYLGLPAGLTLTTYYYFYTSPNDAFQTAQELNFKLAWDDSEAFGRFAMAPWVNLAIETRRTAFGPDEGVGLQMGVEPTLYSVEHESYPVSFTFPVELGLAIDDYYEDETGSENAFGYLSWGLKVSVPLAFVPKELGEWSFSVAGKGFYFSDDLAAVNDGGDDLQAVVVGSFGVSY
jgi:hypothetical protein